MSRSKDWNLLRRCIQKWVLFFITPYPINQPFWFGSSSYCAQYFFMSVRLATVRTLLFLFKFVTSETKESFVTRTNGSLVGALISIGDVSVSIAIVTSDKTVNWILAEGRVRERYIRKGNKNRNKIERWIIFAGYFGLQHKPSTGTKTKRVQMLDESPSIFVFSHFSFCGVQFTVFMI